MILQALRTRAAAVFSRRAPGSVFANRVGVLKQKLSTSVPLAGLEERYATSVQVNLSRLPSLVSGLSLAPPPPKKNSRSQSLWQLMHWTMGAGILTCVGTVKYKQYTDDKKLQGKLMNLHKSAALIVAALLPMRIALRLTTAVPAALPGSIFEQTAAQISHGMLYVLMTFMPISGILMGYFGGKGLPFFGYTIPGAEKPVKSIA